MILTIEQIQKTVTDYFKDKPVDNISLFGSYARGEAKDESDIDLAFSLVAGTRMSYFKLAEYLIYLEEKLNKKIDLVEIEMFYPRIRKRFEQEKKILFTAQK